LATLTAGTNIAITNTPGGISIAASGVLPVANGGTGSSLAPQFAAYQATAQSISNNTIAVVHYDNVRWDTNSGWNASTYTYTPGVPGYYQVNVSVTMSFASAPASPFQIAAGIYKVVGGTPTLFDYNEISSPAMPGNITPFCASVVQLTNASDGIQGVVLQSSGATYSTYSGGIPQTTISVAFIRGI
jgi:hypothetical protein